MFFARSGFYLNYYYMIRYESYLISISFMVIFIYISLYGKALKKWSTPEKILLSTLLLICLLPFAERGIRTIYKIIPSTHNTYSFQYQLGMFLEKYYQGKTIALNDIGATIFCADIKCIDLMGLSNKHISRMYLQKKYSARNISKLLSTSDAKVAIIYDTLIYSMGGIPPGWIKAGEWRLNKNVISRESTFVFIASGQKEASILSNNLKSFSVNLPSSIIQKRIPH